MHSNYKRVLLKLSGESLGDSSGSGLHRDSLEKIAQKIVSAHNLGIHLAIVIGAGNIFRGNKSGEFSFDPVVADHMGMISTAINGLALSQKLQSLGKKVTLMSAVGIGAFVESYSYARALAAYEAGEIVIFVCGTGNPFFTTDSAAAQRASEMRAEVILKGTKVDGVYSADPMKDASAVRYDEITYEACLEQNITVMDQTAFALCKKQEIAILVFNVFGDDAIAKALLQTEKATLVHSKNSR